MSPSESEIPGAIANGLNCLLADAFASRFLTELALWRADAGSPAQLPALLRQQSKDLDQIIRAVVVRLRVLGGTPPCDMDQLRGLASLTDLTCPEQAAEALDNLVSALLRTAENFDSMGVIARESADAATAQLLFGWLATLQEAVWRLSEARFEYLNG